jgi:hypothetical protein
VLRLIHLGPRSRRPHPRRTILLACDDHLPSSVLNRLVVSTYFANRVIHDVRFLRSFPSSPAISIVPMLRLMRIGRQREQTIVALSCFNRFRASLPLSTAACLDPLARLVKMIICEAGAYMSSLDDHLRCISSNYTYSIKLLQGLVRLLRIMCLWFARRRDWASHSFVPRDEDVKKRGF